MIRNARTKKRRPVVTDTFGNPLARATVRAVVDVLSSPTNVTADGARDFAMCHCEQPYRIITRVGNRKDRAVVYLHAPNDTREFPLDQVADAAEDFVFEINAGEC